MYRSITPERKSHLLITENIFLRELQPNDAEVMLEWENNPNNWEVSGTKTRFTKEEIVAFINAEHSINKNKQIRYVICLTVSKQPIGTIDLFELDVIKKEIGVGVLIAEARNRNKGYATESLKIIIDYCRNELKVVNLFCSIIKDNTSSIRLFEKCGFQFIEERVLFENEVNYYELGL